MPPLGHEPSYQLADQMELQCNLGGYIFQGNGNIVQALPLSDPNQHIEDLVPGNRRQPRNDAQKPRTIRFTATAMRHTTQPRRSHLATRKGRSGTTKAATPTSSAA